MKSTLNLNDFALFLKKRSGHTKLSHIKLATYGKSLTTKQYMVLLINKTGRIKKICPPFLCKGKLATRHWYWRGLLIYIVGQTLVLLILP